MLLASLKIYQVIHFVIIYNQVAKSFRISVAKVKDHKDIKGIYHFTGQESITKYQVCGKLRSKKRDDGK